MVVATQGDWFEITETGLVIHRECTEHEWEELGEELAKNSNSLMWLIGDWLIAGESSGYLPRGKLAEACKRFKVEYQTAAQAKRVCSKIESCRRLQDLGFYHHQEVAGREDAGELLEWAKETGATVQKLREEKKRRQIAEQPKISNATGKHGDASWEFMVGDCRQLPFDNDSFDLVFCSPPYESQRSYSELEFNLCGDEFVAWAADCFMECLRVSKGLVAWVIEGYTADFEYSASPFLLMAEIKKRGGKLRKPVVYHRLGIPGTGGPDWLRNDWEPIVCATKNGRLPWSDNTAMGQPPKQNKPRAATNRHKDGQRKDLIYNDPDIANPGNVIKGIVGCGGLGWKDAHENEAPFPEWLAEFFIRSFCPPGGRVLDPFSGSGTTVSVAVKNGRNAVGVDARESQVWLGETRLMGLTVKQRKEGQGVLI